MKKIIAILLVLVMVLGLAACGGSKEAETTTTTETTTTETKVEETEKIKETLVIARGGDLDTPDPYGSTSAQSQMFANHTHDPLTKNNPDTGELDPVLAKEWKDVNGDGKVWEITLVDNAEWHSGYGKFTADDVVFTWEYINPNAGNVVKPLAATTYTESVEAIDDTHVRFTLINGMYDFPTYLEAKMLCKKAYAELAPEEACKIGTGRYMWSDELNTSGVQFGCTRNDSYWGGTEDLKSKNIVWKVIEDANTQVSALETGEVDMCSMGTASTMKLAADLGDDLVNVITRAGAQSYYFGFNYSRSECQDLEFRKAIAQAMNKDDIAALNFMQGFGGTANENFVTSNGLGYDASVKTYSYDEAAAKAYFDAHPVTRELTLVFYGSCKDAATVMQEQFAKVGLNVTLRQIDGTNWTPFKAAMEEYDFFLDYCAYQGALLYNFNRFFYRGGSSNVYGWASDEYEALQDKVSSAASYEDMLKEFKVLEAWVAENIPIIPWGTNKSIAVTSKKVQGVQLAPTENYIDYCTAYVLE